MGGSSGGSSQPVEQKVTQTQFPEEAKPCYSRLLSRGEGESLQPYSPYPGQRLAQFAPEEQQAFNMTTNLANQGTPWAMQQAQQTAGQLAAGPPSLAQQQAQQTAGQIAGGPNPWEYNQALTTLMFRVINKTLPLGVLTMEYREWVILLLVISLLWKGICLLINKV